MKTWRDVARPIIAKVILEVGTGDRTKLKKALFDAYPFGPRAMHPYKIWLSEIKRQMPQEGFKPVPDGAQMRLFKGE